MSGDFRPQIVHRNRIFAGIHRNETESCHVMGILNVTPDSFHKESRRITVDSAVKAGLQMWRQGATWVDIGGESTRPNADPVSVEDELGRVIPVIEALRAENSEGLISIDTRRPEVARAALDAGADLINDVSGLRDPQMVNIVLESGCGVCIMHMQGTPETMQTQPKYDDCAREVSSQLLETARALVAAGHPVESIVLDPGIGFGKNFEHNLELLQRHDLFRGVEGFAVLWGVSRKSFIGQLTGQSEPSERLSGTLAIASMAHYEHIDIVRVHDVQEHIDLFKVLNAVD
ncbi:MAG: dihydropteroate synthase [Euryarchaeota archaeon]|jgi:dihydropteroate synthase|nr:dihydropteroate synthase [Euryarchaeota archaeon]MBT5594640.1 dihydropteroate synthase [Euryarchaeota archaeon]MBT5843701.1 dihydropteroate synthase [Euryarchaeota archaeon]MBT6641294.1 dihydropteroate synthase [Euryarchaeota archaeon]MBT6845432.1 dihydropteroate synthase [Euryarchaeota archaeon]